MYFPAYPPVQINATGFFSRIGCTNAITIPLLRRWRLVGLLLDFFGGGARRGIPKTWASNTVPASG